jgi:hypothetical protein
MSLPTILIVVGILIMVVALLARRSGPRVTQITRTRHRKSDEDGNA